MSGALHWGLHIQASASQRLDNLTRVASVKVYMARSSTDTAIHEVSELREIFANAPRVAIHAEDGDAFPKRPRGHTMRDVLAKRSDQPIRRSRRPLRASLKRNAHA